jgi:hypothetical protein
MMFPFRFTGAGVTYRFAQPLHDGRIAVIEESAFSGIERRTIGATDRRCRPAISGSIRFPA